MRTVTGRVINPPAAAPDGSSRFSVALGSGPLPRTNLVTRYVPLLADGFDGTSGVTWRDDVGATSVRDGRLSATSERNLAVLPGLSLGDGKVAADFRADRQGGVLVRYRDSGDFILAFYCAKQKAFGFHEVANGTWSGWIGAISTAPIAGARVHMEVDLDGPHITAALSDDAGAKLATGFTCGSASLEGSVGLYHDDYTQLGPQQFSRFEVCRSEKAPAPGTVEVIVPSTLVDATPCLLRGDRVAVTGVTEGSEPTPSVLSIVRKGDIIMETPPQHAKALFPTHLPSREWQTFRAAGFAKPACGVIYRRADTVTNGLALGGVDTGCLDLETTGLLGYCTVFNTHVPRRGPINLPVLGLSTGGRTWVLCDPQVKQGEGGSQTPIEPGVSALKLEGVGTADEIHYWGHYPVADLEFVTDAPISVGLRAWSPFLPGDVVGSMIPGIVFEARLRNVSDARQTGTIAFSFPGPSPREAGTEEFDRREVAGPFRGVAVTGRLASYAVGVIGREKTRAGGELGGSGEAWARIAEVLPTPDRRQPGSSVAVDFALEAGKAKVIRFALTWCAPTWKGGGYNWAESGNTFTHMYAKHYSDPVETGRLLARQHGSLLRRVLAWQQVIYAERKLPVWLRDSLVNVLYMIAEDGYWAQAGPPLPDWVKPEDGLFGMNECPRGCPQIECIPCSFYGSLPLAYFFPELQLSTIRGYQGYQLPDGAPPWIFGGCTGQTPPIDFACPTRGYQFASNGISLAAIVDRFLLSRDTPDRAYLRELYPMVKRSVIHTVGLRTTPSYSLGERIISMPDGNEGTEWLEAPEPGWAGMTAHIAGLHLAELRIAERMAREVGDSPFERQCAAWLAAATEAREQRLWDPRGYYLNYFEPETGKRSDLVFGYQLDGEWITAHHGLPSTLPAGRAKTVLETIRRCNAAVTKYGAANYANPDGTVANPGGYGAYSYFPPELLMLAMAFMYEGQRDFGLELAHKAWHNLVCQQGYTWDMPNIMRGDVDTGERTFGNDYYQDMMLWSLPAALAGEEVSAPCQPGGLVDRVLKTAAGRAD